MKTLKEQAEQAEREMMYLTRDAMAARANGDRYLSDELFSKRDALAKRIHGSGPQTGRLWGTFDKSNPTSKR